MKIFIFFKKKQPITYYLFTVMGVIIAIIILSYGMDNSLNRTISYSVVSIISFISIMINIKQANKEFIKIEIEDLSIKFTFRNKNKKSLYILKSEISILVYDEKMEFKKDMKGELIGIAYKNRLGEIEKWEDLINLVNNGTKK